MNNTFNIFANLNKAISNFDNNTVNVIPADNNGNTERRYLGGGHNGYEFSQRELLIDIDMVIHELTHLSTLHNLATTTPYNDKYLQEKMAYDSQELYNQIKSYDEDHYFYLVK